MNKNQGYIPWLARHLWPKSWPTFFLTIIVIIMILATIALELSLPLFLCYLTFNLQNTYNMPLTILCASYGFIWLASRVLAEVREILTYGPLLKSIYRISTQAFDHLLNLSLDFHVHRRLGVIAEIVKRAQVQFLKTGLGLFLGIVPYCLELLILSIFLLSTKSTELLVVFAFFIISFTSLSVYTSRLTTSFEAAANDAENDVASYAYDTLTNIETIKIFNYQQYHIAKFDRLAERSRYAHIKALSLQQGIHMLQGMIIAITLALLTFIVGKRVVAGTASLGDFVMFHGYVIQLSAPFQQLSKNLRILRETLEDLRGIYDLHTTPVSVQDPIRPQAIESGSPSITFDHVCFEYFLDRPLLKNISFTIPAGTTCAIVGSSGSGKTTIAKLLLKFYEPASGTISIGHTPLSAASQHDIRDHIGYVAQDVGIFHDTLLHNIIYGVPMPSPETLSNIIAQAELGDLVRKLPHGLETLMGERGQLFSGGERQRIVLARMLLKKPSIFIFDEATASLDSKTEEAIMHNVRELTKNKTTLIIAHRLSTIIHADTIIVLEHGAIKEQGTHDELLALNKVYAQLWAKSQRH